MKFSKTVDSKTSSLSPLFGIDWVIVGGESGPNARPMHPDWVRSLCDQCQAAGVPFFFKQWGEWIPHDSTKLKPFRAELAKQMHKDGNIYDWASDHGRRDPHIPTDWAGIFRVGKKAAGAMLDGREWREFPG